MKKLTTETRAHRLLLQLAELCDDVERERAKTQTITATQIVRKLDSAYNSLRDVAYALSDQEQGR